MCEAEFDYSNPSLKVAFLPLPFSLPLSVWVCGKRLRFFHPPLSACIRGKKQIKVFLSALCASSEQSERA